MRCPTVLLLTALAACKAGTHPTEAPEPTRSTEAIPPVRAEGSPAPAGPLVAEPVVIAYAVYAVPDGKEDVEAAAKAVHRQSFEHLAVLTPSTTDPTLPGVEIDVPAMNEFAPPDPEMLKYFGRGLDAAQVQAVQRSPKVVVMTFVSDAANAGKVYADAGRMAAAVANRSGGLVWDEETRELYGHDAWRERIEASIEVPTNLPRHFTIHAYRDGELVRMVTLGMRKFGLPDIVVEDVPGTVVGSMQTVVNLIALTIAAKKALAREGVLEIDVGELSGTAPPPGVGRATVHLVATEPEEGDPNNRLVRVVFPGPRESLHERQVALVDALLGSEESVTAIEHDAEILAASKQAREELRALKPRFTRAMPERELLLVKAPFETSGGGTEWMWVEVTSWKGGEIGGILQSEPFDVPGLRAGARVQVKEESVFDYVHQMPDGTRTGNRTEEIMLRRGGGR